MAHINLEQSKSTSSWRMLGAVAVALAIGSLLVITQRGLEQPTLLLALGPMFALASAVPALGAMWLGAAGWGFGLRKLLRGESWLLPVQLAAGMAVQWWLGYVAAWAGLLGPALAWGLPVVGVVLLAVQLAQPTVRVKLTHQQQWSLPAWPWLLAIPGLMLLLAAASCPPGTLWAVEAFGYDVMSYHLQLPREWLALGAMRGLEHNVYSFQPGLMELAYALVGAMRGSMYEGIIAAQLLHASMVVLAAWCAAAVVRAITSNALAAAVAGVLLMTTPWVIITGSLAYNEAGVLAFAAASLAVIFDRGSRLNWRDAAVVGLLCGAAMLCKLTAGPMLVLPIALVVLFRWHAVSGTTADAAQAATNEPARWRPDANSAGLAVVVAMVSLLVLGPWLARNAVATGNPVFPFATSLFGSGHWSEQQVARWNASHLQKTGPAGTAEQGFAQQLGQQWLTNTGYGAVGGHAHGGDRREVARFQREGGVPVLWTLALAGAIAGLTQPGWRRATLALLLMQGVQVAFWWAFTHQQSRFLLPTLLPGTTLVAMLFALLWQQRHQAVRAAAGAGVALTAGLLASVAYRTFFEQTAQGVPPVAIIDSLPTQRQQLQALRSDPLVGNHPLNHLPAGAKVLMIADASVLYVRTDLAYSSAYDRSLLAELWQQHAEPAAVTRSLKQLGFTHVWVHWSEFERIGRSFGYDPDLGPAELREITSSWTLRQQSGPAALFALP